MKRVYAIIGFLVLLSSCTASMCVGAEDNWRFWLEADDGANMYSAAAMTIGAHPNCLDGNYSDQMGSDSMDRRFPISIIRSSVKAVEGCFAGMLWSRDVKSARPPWTDPIYYDASYPPYYHRKVWELRVAGLSAADTSTPIRLLFLTLGSDVLPTATISHQPIKYYLNMVDNKGLTGSPANGTIWEIPIPTVHSSTAYFALTLPTLNISEFTEGSFINDGYKMEFWQEAVPEPSSMMALGAGLISLAGYGLRRRRA
jgi:hypothetical protein